MRSLDGATFARNQKWHKLAYDTSGTEMNHWLACAALVVALALPRFCIAQTGDPPTLLHPSGAYGVGRVAFDWTDTRRPDPFSSPQNGHRELLDVGSRPTGTRPFATTHDQCD